VLVSFAELALDTPDDRALMDRVVHSTVQVKNEGSIRISYALPDGIEQKVNAGGAHGPSRLSGLAV